MIRGTCLFILCFTLSCVSAQNLMPGAEKMPEFVGGEKAWNKYLKENSIFEIEFDEKKRPSNQVMIKVTFDISGNGTVDSIMRHANAPQYDDEALRLIKNMPKWIPASNNGKPVSMKMILPVKFK